MTQSVVKGKIKTNTFGYMFIGAKYFLKSAQEDAYGQFYNLISCLIFSAFTLEAYFNHLGKLRNKDWDKVERKIPKAKKYKIFTEQLGVKIKLDQRPYSSILELFQFRDTMAHGKSSVEYVCQEMELPLTPPFHFDIGPDWKKYASLENAEKCIEDVTLIIKELHSKAGYHGDPFNDLGSGLYSTTEA